jgi:23S rRNA (cytidine1920-2'-O)/16S rRNA (cytidine1409-2'-O)-methyltransferase
VARPRARLDALLVARGLAPNAKAAAALVMTGAVVVGPHRLDKPGALVALDAEIRVRDRRGHAYVSRGGLKLAGALDAFGVDPTNRVCLDLGASTGGFTDCLLQRGAAQVYAVDVGYGLLDWRLQGDPRVVNLERTHAADLDTARVPQPVELLVADISFNSLTRLLAPAVRLLAPGADLALLVKPQFEAAPHEVGPGGIVTDPAVWSRAVAAVRAEVVALGLRALSDRPSDITGARGNVEFWLHAQRRVAAGGPDRAARTEG